MLPSVAFVLLNTPNDFINDFNRYPEAFETVSLIQYPRVRTFDENRSMSSYQATTDHSESIVKASFIRDSEMFARVAGSFDSDRSTFMRDSRQIEAIN